MTTEYRIDLKGNSLYFSGNINESSAHDFVIKLKELEYSIQDKQSKECNLYLSSPGGSVVSGIRMYEALKLFKGKITCYTEGFVASMGIIVMCGATCVKCSPLTTFLIHQTTSWFDGKFHDNKAFLNWVETCLNYMVDIYNKKTKGKVTAEMLKDEVYLTAQQALDLGLVDEILNYF